MDQEKDVIISQIRSCLISTKGKLTLRQLENDYHTLLGDRIPYKKFGYKTLEQFLNSIPYFILSKGPNGELLVDSKSSDQVAHISSMIKKQKTKSRKNRKPPRHRVTTTTTQYHPPANHWRPKNIKTNKKPINQTPLRPSLLKVHTQFVNYSQKPPQQPSTTTTPITKTTIETQNQNNKENVLNHNQYSDNSVLLKNTRKRISDIMARINLDRDSGNSSPTIMDISSSGIKPSNQQFQPTGNPVEDLKSFVRLHDLGNMEISFYPIRELKKTYQSCKIKIGTRVFSNYPDKYFMDKQSAEIYTAKKALNELIPKQNKRKSLLISSNEDILERIPPLLQKHSNALWASQLEADYIDYYNEQLPTNWLQIIDSSQSVHIEKCQGGYVLKYCKPNEVLQKGIKWDINLSLNDISVPLNTIEFNNENTIEAIITHTMTTMEIWCQQINSEIYKEYNYLMDAMINYYKINKLQLKAVTINVNSYYVIDNDDYFSRIRILEKCNDKYDFYNCFLIDTGEDLDIHKDNIYHIRREFATVQAQAFLCKLAGLEDLNDASKNSDALANLNDKEVILELVSPYDDDEDDLATPVVMYDAKTGESINETLISLLTLESATPRLENKTINEVYVTHIADNGDVYVKIAGSNYKHLDNLLNELIENLNDMENLKMTKVTKENSKNRLYLCKNKTINKWCRAELIDWSPLDKNLAQIYFIDIGEDYVINVNNEIFYPLDKLNDVINQYPPQVINVKFMIDQIPNDFVEMAQKLMPPDQILLLKINNYQDDKAVVEIFKRGNDETLLCVNKAIDMNLELRKKQEGKDIKKSLSMMAKFTTTEIKNVPSGGRLRKPSLPPSNQFFNVKIPFAVNPWNFFVQPLSSFDELCKLMKEMQKIYDNEKFELLKLDDIIPGNIYASKHDDGSWYRTSVLKVIHSGSISVFFCDFGYYTNLSLNKLVKLDTKFMELPYQALKAKLLGIKPIQNKWSVDDCELFRQIVQNKSFSSVIHGIEKDELYKSDSILNLTLIDTSTEDDIKVHETLIQKGIAVYS